MKIVTWNVNGLRSLIKEFGGIDNVFRVLDADIVCFQESRIGPDDISIGMIPDGYDAFLSSCTFNKGYAGVITYTHLPILPKVAFTTLKDFLYSEYISNEKQIFDSYESSFIDKANDEGRLVILVFDNAILMNIYFPANNEEERADFRKDFYYLIKDILLQIDRSVYSLFIVGDFNTACGIIDSAFLEDDHDKNGFVEQFRSMSEWLELIQLPLKEKGCSLIDTYRILHPDQRNAYTCFCNILGGRETNFGTRIDYIFCDQSLEKSLQSSAILSTIKGSDHLPVRTEIQFEFHSKTTCVGLRQMVKSQAKIDHFFTKQIIEKEAKCSVKRKSEWTCRRCTLINPITQMTCEACGFKQPQDSKEQLVDIGIDSLFGKRRKQVRVPLCSGHHLPCVRHQVMKEGKNKGKFFYFSCTLFIAILFFMVTTSLLHESITDIVCDYLEVILHNFFYYTHYYDSILFERRTKYNAIAYMCRSPDVIIYIQNLVKSIRSWLSRDGLLNIRFQLNTVDGEVIQAIALKQVYDSFTKHESIDYDKLEQTLHNSLLSFQSLPFITQLPDDVQFSVLIDVCEVATAKSENGWDLYSSSEDRKPLFPNAKSSSIIPISTIYAGETSFQVFCSISSKSHIC